MPRTKKVETVDKTAEAILSLAVAIKSLEDKIDGLKISPSVAATTPESTTTVTVPSDQIMNTNVTPEEYFPAPYRQIINERLNKNFKAKIEYRNDGMFGLFIWVPKEYSNASANHWSLNKEDLRFRAIENALGEIGVREWVDKIAENLGVDIMRRVVDDGVRL
jgi:hypothetical protein